MRQRRRLIELEELRGLVILAVPRRVVVVKHHIARRGTTTGR
jgi:hypothetical protein